MTRDNSGPLVKWRPVLRALVLDLSLLLLPFHCFSGHLILVAPTEISHSVSSSRPTHYSVLLVRKPDDLFCVNGGRLSSPLAPRPAASASASPVNLPEMHFLGPHLLNPELWGWDPVASAVRSPSRDSSGLLQA